MMAKKPKQEEANDPVVKRLDARAVSQGCQVCGRALPRGENCESSANPTYEPRVRTLIKLLPTRA